MNSKTCEAECLPLYRVGVIRRFDSLPVCSAPGDGEPFCVRAGEGGGGKYISGNYQRATK